MAQGQSSEIYKLYIFCKDKHAVSNAINILNSNIDKKICGTGSTNWNNAGTEAAGKCASGKSSDSGSSNKGLSHMFGVSEYEATKANKMGNHTSDKISKDTTSNLSREEKGIVSSVFAKVIEGAEILGGGSRSKVVRYIIKLYISIRICMQ